jgi:branched-chain amino acid transport system substrate-binding protein
MALFGETDGFALERIRALAGGWAWRSMASASMSRSWFSDSQSDSNRAAEVAGDLILNQEVHMIIPASTTPTITAVADQAELFETPCVSTAAPWQAIIFPRGGAEDPFNWTYHFFWGLDEALNTFVGLWETIDTNRKVGMLFPQNIDGETWGNREYGLPAPTEAAGFDVVVPGFFPATYQRLFGADRAPSATRAARSSAALRRSTISAPS